MSRYLLTINAHYATNKFTRLTVGIRRPVKFRSQRIKRFQFFKRVVGFLPDGLTGVVTRIFKC